MMNAGASDKSGQCHHSGVELPDDADRVCKTEHQVLLLKVMSMYSRCHFGARLECQYWLTASSFSDDMFTGRVPWGVMC